MWKKIEGDYLVLSANSRGYFKHNFEPSELVEQNHFLGNLPVNLRILKILILTNA